MYGVFWHAALHGISISIQKAAVTGHGSNITWNAKWKAPVDKLCWSEKTCTQLCLLTDLLVPACQEIPADTSIMHYLTRVFLGTHASFLETTMRSKRCGLLTLCRCCSSEAWEARFVHEPNKARGHFLQVQGLLKFRRTRMPKVIGVTLLAMHHTCVRFKASSVWIPVQDWMSQTDRDARAIVTESVEQSGGSVHLPHGGIRQTLP